MTFQRALNCTTRLLAFLFDLERDVSPCLKCYYIRDFTPKSGCCISQLWQCYAGNKLWCGPAGYAEGQEEIERVEAGRARLLTMSELLEHLQQRAQIAADQLAQDTNAQVLNFHCLDLLCEDSIKRSPAFIIQ